MILALKIVIAFLLPWLLGYAALALFLKRDTLSKPFRWGAAYLLGMGLLSQWMLAEAWLFQTISLTVTALPLLLVTGLLLLACFLKKDIPVLAPAGRVRWSFNRWELLFISVFLYYSSMIFWESMHMPIYLWDELNLYAYKAKVFYHTGGLQCLANLPLSNYPLYIPFQLLWLAQNLGFWDEQIVKIVFPVNYLAFMSVSYGFLKMSVGRQWAWAALVLLLGSSMFTVHSTIAYSDFALMAYVTTAIMSIILWQRNADKRMLVVASLFAGFAAFTKVEGVGIFVIGFLLTVFAGKSDVEKYKRGRLKSGLLFLLPGLTVYGHYLLYRLCRHPSANGAGLDKLFLETSFTLPEPRRAAFLSMKFLHNMFIANNWNILWFILPVLLLLLRKRNPWRRWPLEIRTLVAAIILLLGYYFSGLLFTEKFRYVVNDTALSRSLLVVFPLVVYAVVIAGRLLQGEKDRFGETVIMGCLWGAAFFLSFGVVCFTQKTIVDPVLLAKSLALSLYVFPSMNMFHVYPVLGLNVYILLYMAFMLVLCLGFLFYGLMSRLPNPLTSDDRFLRRNLWVLLGIALTAQALAYNTYYSVHKMRDRTTAEFYRKAYGRDYVFLNKVSERVHPGASITLDFLEQFPDDPPQRNKIIFNYFLYPRVDLRHACANEKPYDYIIITDPQLAGDARLADYDLFLQEGNYRLYRRKE